MNIKNRSKNGYTILVLDGSFDANTSPQVQEAVESSAEENCKLILDMEGCSFVSSAGLRVLLLISKLIKTKNGTIILTALSEEIKDVMEMTGFDHYFEYADSINSAIEI